MTTLTLHTKQEVVPMSAHLVDVLSHAHAPATMKAIQSDALAWIRWSEQRNIPSTPPIRPADLAEWLVSESRSGLKPSTIARRSASIAALHRAADLPSPTSSQLVKDTLAGIRRQKGTRPEQKSALLRQELEEMISLIPTDDMRGLRDRALLLVGFAGGFRRSELVALKIEDLTFSSEGVIFLVRKSKTDQEGAGFEKAISYASSENAHLCPVVALQAWLDLAGIEEGAVFRAVTRHGKPRAALSPQSVALIAKSRAEAAGINPERIGAHSLRAGMATQAAKDGYSERQIANVGGWRSTATLRGYIRRGTAFEDAARVI